MKLTVVAILVAAAVLGAALLFLSNGGDAPRLVSVQREAMGVPVTISVYDRNLKQADAAIEAAFGRMAQIESITSTTDETSELSTLNRLDLSPAASTDLAGMLRLSFVVNQVSDGAFDVTIGPLIDLWQATPSCEVQTASIAVAKRHVGMTRILLGSGHNPSISLVPGTRIDLDGIAVGYAVDAAVAALQDAGIESALVQAGVAYRGYGGAPDGEAWEIALASSRNPDEIITRFEITDGAIATVGTPDRFFNPTMQVEQVLDPRTGYPATALSSATVLAPTCAEACALATTVFVLGPERGLALIERFASNQAFLLGYEDPRTILRSSGMAAFEGDRLLFQPMEK
jgi:thiamine biosynthesis lipoprotein